MFKDFIDGIAKLAVDAATPKILLESPYGKSVAMGGAVFEVETPTLPRAHKVASLDDLIALANRFGEGVTGAPPSDGEPPAAWKHDFSPVVWYDERGAVLVIDSDGDRLDRVSFDYKPSDVFTVIRALRNEEKAFSQRDFIKLLRVDLAGTLDDGVLLNRVRKLDFTAASKTSAEINKSKETYGNTITNECKGSTEIPDTVTLAIPVSKSYGERETFPLRCAVVLDTRSQTLALVPLPDEIELVEQMSIISTQARLAAGLDDVPYYYGRP